MTTLDTNAETNHTDHPSRYHGPPIVFIENANGVTRPAPFLMSRDDLSDFLRLHDSKTKFPSKTIQRYRKIGLPSIRVGRRVWFRLDDVLQFLDKQQERVTESTSIIYTVTS